MPERDRLARTLFLPVPLRSPEGRSALRDLVALYQDDGWVAYQPVLRPISGCCPVCPVARGRFKGSIPVADRWNHVYRCYEADLKRRYGFAMFCFRCSEWITSKAGWEFHCQGHIDRFDVPLRCDPITFRYALACAGYFPRCLRKSERPAAERMYQFTNRARWLQHVQKKTSRALIAPRQSDVHVAVYAAWYSRRKRRLDSGSQSDTSEVKSDTDQPKPKRPRLQGKRHTPTLSPKPDRDGCHGIKAEPPNDTPHYDFVNYSVTDLEPSSADLTTPATTPCSSSGDDFLPNATETASIQDNATAASLREPSHSPAYVDTLHQIDPRLLPQPTVPPVQDGEHAYPLDGGHSLRDVVTTQGNTREPTTELRSPECLPSHKQSVQEPGPPAVTLDDGQCIVERLLGRKVVSRGKGRRKRMVVQYWVKWQGWSGEYNEWVDEDDIHEDLVTAYNSATASA
ncbi:hypothetical protein F5Y03DRAFT_402698 [Xylaria venustula]|nr:hypothetical protein F5Y03DRAFT_402698 [Xylaria venustula]